ncbi:sugar kinase [Microbacterium sp. NPDC090007]|uniref:sugar kinase n=1 Tax=Microbacterium sp. NPDC090007 TaxID=3364204 RepID=UPI003811851C
MSGVFTFGETMGLVRADSGPWETAHRASVGIGGADSNVAIGLARLGIRASWLGRVGDDALGRRVVRELRAEGIEVHARVVPGTTGLMLKEKRTPHTTSVLFYRAGSAGSTLAREDVPMDIVRDADLVHVTGITAALSRSARATVEVVIDTARDANVPVSFDVNHRPNLWRGEDPGELYRSLAARSDIVFAGDDEARLLLGPDALLEAPLALAQEIGDLGPREVVIKLGRRGSLAVIDGRPIVEPAISVPVVDTVGAGDAFVAGYLAALLSGSDARGRVRHGVTAGAFACLHAGDWEGLPRPADLALLDSEEPVTR